MNLQKIRADFPILSREVYGKPLVYFDNGATTQKPRQVVDAITDEYYSVNANVHRGVHFLSQQATELHEASRETVRKFINAGSTNEIIFTRGTTESINLFVSSFGEEFMQEGDEVILSVMEHHSNIVPWQLLAAKRGIAIKVIPMNDRGELLLDEYKQLFSERTKIVSVAHVSNVLGTVNPVGEMIGYAHEQGVPVLVDGASPFRICRWMYGTWMRISTFFPVIRCTGLPVWACFTVKKNGSTRCPLIRVAAK